MKKKRTHAEKQRLITQIICIALAALMILGVVMSILPFSAMTAHAADMTDTDAQISAEDTVEEAKEPTPGLLLRIGLMFGSGVTESFAVRANDGFTVYHVDKTTDAAAPLYETTVEYAAVTQDANLALNEDGMYVPASKGVIIGGYHLQLPKVYADAAALAAGVDDINTKLKNAGIYSNLIYAFPSYVNDGLYVCIGDFGSSSSAAAKAQAIQNATGEQPNQLYPRDNAVTLLSPDSNLILFEYASKDGSFGLSARGDDDYDQNDPNALPEENFLITPAKNTYRGIFLFERYKEGVSVVNLIDLENYIAGVIPYEVSSSWKPEALKAFACAVRSYAIFNRDHHSSYGFDLCNGSDCQVYMGTKKEDDAVRSAVLETEGLIVTYNNKPCATLFSAVTGGSTVNSEQIWNGAAYPYLRAVRTPWEDYASHTNGVWLTEYSGYQLYTRLYNRGYTKLKGAIAEINISALAENSDYVYLLELTDIYGVKITLKGTDIIRTALGLKSANFYVGHNGSIPLLNRVVEVLTADAAAPLPITEAEESKTMQVMTADGIKEVDVTEGLVVLQADGTEKLVTEKPDSYDIPEDAQQRLDSDTNNFLFIGRGWGHGGGISQWGIMSMANQGATWEEIIHAYFTDVVIQSYYDLP